MQGCSRDCEFRTCHDCKTDIKVSCCNTDLCNGDNASNNFKKTSCPSDLRNEASSVLKVSKASKIIFGSIAIILTNLFLF